VVGQLNVQAAFEDGLDQLGQDPALPGQLYPARLGAADQLVEPGVIGQLLAQLPTGQPARPAEPRPSRHRKHRSRSRSR
jgi:hypothetical protein